MTTTTTDRQSTRPAPATWTKPRVPIVKCEGVFATCSCGWVSKRCTREKVRQDRIDAHLSKRHDGQGIRM